MTGISPIAVLSQKTGQIENRINARLSAFGINIKFSSVLAQTYAAAEKNNSESKLRKTGSSKKTENNNSAAYKLAGQLMLDTISGSAGSLYSGEDNAGSAAAQNLTKYMAYNYLTKNSDMYDLFLSDDIQSELKKIKSEQMKSDLTAFTPAAALMSALF